MSRNQSCYRLSSLKQCVTGFAFSMRTESNGLHVFLRLTIWLDSLISYDRIIFWYLSQIVGDTCYFEINVIVFHEPIFHEPRTFHRNLEQISLCCSPFCLLQITVFLVFGEIAGNSSCLKFETCYKHSITVPCFILTRHPKWSFNSLNSNLDVWPKKTQFYVMSILIFIPVVC